MTEKTHIPLLSLSQLIHFNKVRERRNSGTSRHTSAHETPLSIYLAFLLHSQTRSHLLVDKFHDLGLPISYDQMLVLSRQLGNSVYPQIDSDGVICATKLRSHVFTTSVVDNIDRNPSSRFAKDFWHGTAISSTQHLESKTDGIKRCSVQLVDTALVFLQPLPKEYTTVYPFVFKSTEIYVPRLPKRKDLVPFGVSLIWYHAQLKRQTNAYFFM